MSWIDIAAAIVGFLIGAHCVVIRRRADDPEAWAGEVSEWIYENHGTWIVPEHLCAPREKKGGKDGQK